MARGAQAELGLLNSQAQNEQQQGNALLGGAPAAIQSQIQNPGYDPTTAAAIRASGVNTANSALDAAKFSAAQRAGQTGNDAMYYASADKLARGRAGAVSNAALSAEENIGETALTAQQKAIQEASQLYGYNTSAATSLYGTGQKAQSTWQSPLDQILQTAGTVGGAATTKYCWIAEELYGADDPRVNLLRRWLLFAPKPIWWAAFARLYSLVGERVAEIIQHNMPLRNVVARILARAVRRAIRLTPVDSRI